MTHHQKELVRTSFAGIYSIEEEFSILFYSRLFEIAPYLRPIIKGEDIEQGTTLTQAFHRMIDSLDCIEEISPALILVGHSAASIGIKNGHFDIIASALLWTLERTVGSNFTDDVRNAWVSLYVEISPILKKTVQELY